MSFFIRNKKRKITKKVNGAPKPSSRLKPKSSHRDEEIESESDEEEVEKPKRDESSAESESDGETAQEKKIRLAKQYIEELKQQETEKNEEGGEAISVRLKQDYLEQAGKLQRQVADEIQRPDENAFITMRGHKLAPTCVCIHPNNTHLFTASKDCSIIKWDVKTCRKCGVIQGTRNQKKQRGHTSDVISLALSSDGVFLASGDKSGIIHVWKAEDLSWVHTFLGHKGPVSGLTFRRTSHQLYSSAHDRLVKVWSVDDLAYVETLFGHQDAVQCIDSLTRERCVTAGGRDGTLRVWKIIEESQLVFMGHSGSIDCVCLINEETFLSGADDGSLALWCVMKKKPSFVLPNAHNGQWIVCVGALKNSDLVASGSLNGHVKLWKCGGGFRSLTLLFDVPMVGVVNCLQFSDDGQMLAVAVGQEHRLGRWWKVAQAKNRLCVVRLSTQ